MRKLPEPTAEEQVSINRQASKMVQLALLDALIATDEAHEISVLQADELMTAQMNRYSAEERVKTAIQLNIDCMFRYSETFGFVLTKRPLATLHATS